MPRAIDSFRQTHDLCDVLDSEGVLTVRFSDGRDFELCDCWPVDSSVSGDRGRWCCSVEQCLSADQRDRLLFRPGTGLDVLEKDIVIVVNKTTGEILYHKT
jgi:hypothetical protein